MAFTLSHTLARSVLAAAFQHKCCNDMNRVDVTLKEGFRHGPVRSVGNTGVSVGKVGLRNMLDHESKFTTSCDVAEK